MTLANTGAVTGAQGSDSATPPHAETNNTEDVIKSSMPASTDLRVGSDGLARASWAYSSQQMLEYYDTEWGMPIRDESGLFERISLEAFQSGLSWATVLRKREAFRSAFRGFDPELVAGFTTADIESLMQDSGIIRNRSKIEATICNATSTLQLRGHGGLAEFVWSFQPSVTPHPEHLADIPTSSKESTALAAGLREAGFKFVGPTTMYALMEAIGMVDTHLVGSHRRGASGVWPTT